MIYVTGDTHGVQSRFETFGQFDGRSWNEDDYLIVCGDFGYLFRNNAAENAFLDRLENLPYQILFVDGNHENFPAIYSYPVEEWKGGAVHRIRKNIRHLMRGEIFEIDGKTFFAMGGAYSVDRAIREKNVSFWEEEIPSPADYKRAIENLEKCGKRVDYILTHTAPREVILRMGYSFDLHDAELTGFLEWVMYEVSFRRWFFGHWHTDREVYDRMRAISLDVEPIG